MTKENNDSVNELITKHLAGEITADEQNQLSSWISESQENRRYFDDYKKAFDLTEKYFGASPSDAPHIDIDREWDHFVTNIGAGKPVRQLSATRIWLRIAASLLLIAATAGILYFYTLPKNVSYQTAGNRETVTLPDGSQVTLNRNTLLTYDPDFGDNNRTVSLNGEAFFDVEPDAAKPFIILTDNARIQVLGTSFNVTAYDSLSAVEVIVQTGVVSLETKTGKEMIKLTAGKKGVYTKATNKLDSTVNDDVNFQSWNTQRLVFIENDLRSVIETLKKNYNADITISADVPSTCVVTVTFDHQSLVSVLRVLESTLNLKYTINGNKVVITEAGC